MIADRRGELKKYTVGMLVVASLTVPIFRSGGRTGLSFWGWIFNHTIFGPPVEYVPEEDYARELDGVRITPTVEVSGGNIDESPRFPVVYYGTPSDSGHVLTASGPQPEVRAGPGLC